MPAEPASTAGEPRSAAAEPAPAQGPAPAPLGHVLLLGGTTEARRLAEALARRAPYRVTTSLAGRVAAPVLPPGEVRIGGFGGPVGLAEWIAAHGVTHLIDATHPFAERMSFNAAAAARSSGLPLLALRRPGWTPGPGDDWTFTDSLAGAAAALPSLGGRAFLTTGRTGLHVFAELTETWFLVRSVDPPAGAAPPRLEVLLARGPFGLDEERELLARHRIEVLVTKDSGGSATAPKLTAAREAGIPVLVVRRPPVPSGVAEAGSVEAALRWLETGGGRAGSA
ncbi:cobalt-precorrin-6A reductase [Streptomyces sp. NPDC001568]|uniref:cobalt-precorrin-6A reductase n=1 Tax=Streptomyces sp. NPDC001568 TaxID=3364588 RepID=UPI0036B4ED86